MPNEEDEDPEDPEEEEEDEEQSKKKDDRLPLLEKQVQTERDSADPIHELLFITRSATK